MDIAWPQSNLYIELPSTALPCRLRHVPQQSAPSLDFEPGPFNTGIAKLQEHKFGSKMQHYQPPVDDNTSLFDDDAPCLTTSEDLSHVYSCWTNLPEQTRQNLLLFEEPEFELRSSAEGVSDVATLVSSRPASLRVFLHVGCTNIARAAQRHCKALSPLSARVLFWW
jgi:hypothetical protein